MEPIVLTVLEESLGEYPGSESTDENELHCCVGVHQVCDSWVDIREVSEKFRALVCRGCHLRVVIPKSVRTYGQLREYCKTAIDNIHKETC